jgi:hypothetical protein
MGLNFAPGYCEQPGMREYWPQPQIPVTRPLASKYYIDITHPNPFTVKPIATEWRTNELIMRDPVLRVGARIGVEDIGQKQASNYVSPMHLRTSWHWCGGYQGCETH